MVDVTGKASPVEFTDALQAGFAAAMARVDELALNPCTTLVDQISADEWAAWDACEENAIVMDKDGLNGYDDDDGAHHFDMAA